MPRGTSERGSMMEINGEWQLGGLNSLQRESVRRREVTAADVILSELLHHCKQKEQPQRRERLLKPQATVIQHLSRPRVLAQSQSDRDTRRPPGK